MMYEWYSLHEGLIARNSDLEILIEWMREDARVTNPDFELMRVTLKVQDEFSYCNKVFSVKKVKS